MMQVSVVGRVAKKQIVGVTRRWKATQAMPKDSVQPTGGAPASSSSTQSSVPIGASLLAALAGATVVSGGAAIVENATAGSCLPYSHNGQRFSQDEFSGRFCRMLLACDPRLLLYSEGQVRQAQELLERSHEYANDRGMDRTLWEARRIADAALHPDTKEVIPRPFRMSGYVPYNGPICVAMVASTSTMPLLFWSWVNQSQNALVNYYVSSLSYLVYVPTNVYNHVEIHSLPHVRLSRIYQTLMLFFGVQSRIAMRPAR